MLDRIKHIIVPVVMVIVATIQMVSANKTELTRWRGGGYGMYAELNWISHEVWFYNVPMGIDYLTIHSDLANKVRRNPSDKNLQALGDAVKAKHNLSNFYISVWKLQYDNSTNVITKRKANEINIQ